MKIKRWISYSTTEIPHLFHQYSVSNEDGIVFPFLVLSRGIGKARKSQVYVEDHACPYTCHAPFRQRKHMEVIRLEWYTRQLTFLYCEVALWCYGE